MFRAPSRTATPQWRRHSRRSANMPGTHTAPTAARRWAPRPTAAGSAAPGSPRAACPAGPRSSHPRPPAPRRRCTRAAARLSPHKNGAEIRPDVRLCPKGTRCAAESFRPRALPPPRISFLPCRCRYTAVPFCFSSCGREGLLRHPPSPQAVHFANVTHALYALRYLRAAFSITVRLRGFTSGWMLCAAAKI